MVCGPVSKTFYEPTFQTVTVNAPMQNMAEIATGTVLQNSDSRNCPGYPHFPRIFQEVNYTPCESRSSGHPVS